MILAPLLLLVAVTSLLASQVRGQDRPAATPPSKVAPSKPTPPLVRIAVSVDWEGRNLAPVNLQVFATWHEKHPQVPLTHFLNAAYFTKRDADAKRITASIRKVLRPGDEIGLHIHPWRSLVTAAGVTFRDTPSIWGNRRARPTNGDTGHAIVIEAYDVKELRAIIAKSKQLLAAHGFVVGSSFRAGAWLAGPNVREAIRREGFRVDSSATNSAWHDELQRTALPGLIDATWPGITVETQPFAVGTPGGTLLEMPDTCALADYVTAEEMADHVTAAVKRLSETGPDVYAHLGFHQETAARYGSRVIEAVAKIKALHADRVVFETLQASAARARIQLHLGDDAK